MPQVTRVRRARAERTAVVIANAPDDGAPVYRTVELTQPLHPGVVAAAGIQQALRVLAHVRVGHRVVDRPSFVSRSLLGVQTVPYAVVPRPPGLVRRNGVVVPGLVCVDATEALARSGARCPHPPHGSGDE